MNIYWTKIMLRAAAKQAIYLMLFHWVVGSLYLNWYINFTTRLFNKNLLQCLREGSDQSGYRPVNLFLNWKNGGHFLCCPTQAEKWGTRPPRPQPIDAHAV